MRNNYTALRFIGVCLLFEILRVVQVVWELVVTIVKSTLRASLIKSTVAIPRWQVAQMLLDAHRDT